MLSVVPAWGGREPFKGLRNIKLKAHKMINKTGNISATHTRYKMSSTHEPNAINMQVALNLLHFPAKNQW